MKKFGVLAAALALLTVASVGSGAAAEEAGKVVTDAWYTYTGEKGAAGHFHLVRKQTADEAAPVRIEVEWRVVVSGKVMWIKMETLSRDDACFSPMRIVFAGEGREIYPFGATIDWRTTKSGKEGTLKVSGARNVRVTLPEGTMDLFSVFERVRQLPFDKEKPFKFHVFKFDDLRVDENHTLTYRGQMEIMVGDRGAKAHHFEETVGTHREAEYWVNDKRELVRVVMDENNEFLLSTEAEARKLLEKPGER